MTVCNWEDETLRQAHSMPQLIIDELWFSVSQVVPVRNKTVMSAATGSFYETGGKRFLVTNRHVVVDESKGRFPDALRFFVHTDGSDLRKNRELLIRLYDESKRPRWLEHPSYGSKVDIVAVNLEGILPSQSVIRFITSEDLFPNNAIPRFCEDCAVLGYPLDFYDRVNNLPVLRNAMVSTPYPVGFQGNPYFLVDAKLHNGSSGSPVFTKSQPGFRMRSGRAAHGPGMGDRFLGIISMHVSPKYTDDKLDLHWAWFGYLVEQIASQHRNTQTHTHEA
jgi:V8-like Glu-specific endopeptidase